MKFKKGAQAYNFDQFFLKNMSKLYLERLFKFHLCRCEFKRKQNKKQKNLKGKKFSINKKKN